MSLAGAQQASSRRLFQLPVARAIGAQLILAVSFLHSEGIVHNQELIPKSNLYARFYSIRHLFTSFAI
jgi:hypothetical protein